MNQICMLCGLNAIERDILLLCAAVEIDPIFRQIFATVQQETSLAYPTFSLFDSYFPGFDWSVISEKSPLIRYGLINIGEGPTLTLSPLRINKRVFCGKELMNGKIFLLVK